MKTVTPKTFLVGVTSPRMSAVAEYLKHTGQEEFLSSLEAATCGPELCLVSMFAKMCYKSLVPGKNANVTRIRDIEENLMSTLDAGHGSVFEHVSLNFVTTDCSRVFTHELVRHRVGTAFSQTSGRYVSIESLDVVLPPELADPTEGVAQYVQETVELLEARLRNLRSMLIKEGMVFADKKRLTSAIRRLAPNGQANEIAWTVNVRALRHLLEMRTSRAAEWEMRVVFADVARIIQERWPLMLHGGRCETVDGLPEWSDLHV